MEWVLILTTLYALSLDDGRVAFMEQNLEVPGYETARECTVARLTWMLEEEGTENENAVIVSSNSECVRRDGI